MWVGWGRFLTLNNYDDDNAVTLSDLPTVIKAVSLCYRSSKVKNVDTIIIHSFQLNS